MPWFVYILRCSDNSLYCGTTTDLEGRLRAHNSGIGARYTRSRLPVQLVWHLQATSKSEAFKEEFGIKRLHKAEKELLVTCQTGGKLTHSNHIGGIVMTKAEPGCEVGRGDEGYQEGGSGHAGLTGENTPVGPQGWRQNPHRRSGHFCGCGQESSYGVNPQTKAKIKIPATKAPSFERPKH